MAELLLVNPRHKRRKRRSHKRNPRRAMTAKQLEYFGPRKKRRTHKKRRAASAAPVSRKRRHSFRKRYSAATSGFNINRFSKETLMPAAIGAAGAVGVNVIMGYAGAKFLPANFQTGYVGSLVRIAASVGLGLVVGMATKNRATGEMVAAGGVTVELYNILKKAAQNTFPNITLGEGSPYQYHSMGYAGPALTVGDGVGMYVDRGVGMYVDSGMHGLAAADAQYSEAGYNY